ncbi:hypothetical protein ACQQ2N_01565 [Dokdonella sp. MW10]|uniref:hypothetical protein n=1 Tax=Dokdonella sp. MW10 TaxID=2992926 RepID=UPI003F7ECA50
MTHEVREFHTRFRPRATRGLGLKAGPRRTHQGSGGGSVTHRACGFAMSRSIGFMTRLGAALACVACAPVMAATWQDAGFHAFDTTVRSDAGVVRRGQVLVRRFGNAPSLVDLGLPAGVRVAGLALTGNDILFTPDTAFASGGIVATPRDVVRHGASGVSMFLRGSDLGLPANVRIDALALAGTDVLLSVDVAARIGATAIGPADILRWNGTSVSVLHASHSLGLSPGTNLIALERFADGSLLMGFDTAGTVGGVAFKPGDILEYIPASGRWSMARGSSRFGVTCDPCVLVAFAASGNPDVVFRSSMERYED